MRPLLLILILCITTCVNTYGKAGAYERILYYYAYKLDCAIHKVPTKFAPKCGSDCTFNGFIKLIDALGHVDITQEEFPEIDTTTAALESLALTEKYNPDFIVPGARPDPNGSLISHVLEAVADFLQNNIDQVEDKKYRAKIADAARKVMFNRKCGQSEAIAKKVPIYFKHAFVWTYTTKTMFYKTREKQVRNIIDIAATAYSIKKHYSKDLRSEFTRVINLPDVSDKGHKANIKACRNILRAVQQELVRDWGDGEKKKKKQKPLRFAKPE